MTESILTTTLNGQNGEVQEEVQTEVPSMLDVFGVDPEVFTRYELTFKFRDAVVGGVPKNPKLIEGWLRTKAGIEEKQELMRVILRTMEEAGTPPPDGFSFDDLKILNHKDPDRTYDIVGQAAELLGAEMQTNGFKIDERGLYLEDRQFKAGLKECTNILFAGDRWGRTKKGPKNFVAERLHTAPARLHLGVAEPDGVFQFTGHINDRNGPRAVLTAYEYCTAPTVRIEVMSAGNEVSLEQFAKIFDLFKENGLGALRSQGYGRFDPLGWRQLEKGERVA